MGNKSKFIRDTVPGQIAKKHKHAHVPAVYVQDAEGNVRVDESGKKIVSIPAVLAVTFRDLARRLFGARVPPPPAKVDKTVARARRKPVAKVAAHHVPKYRAAARPAHTRPGCKALRDVRK